LLAFLSRGLGRRWGIALMVPYVALVLALVAIEARIVGAVVARLVPLPPLAGAVAFLVGTWAVARAGVRPGLRAQAIATFALVGGFSLLAGAAVLHARHDPTFVARLLPAAPSLLAFAGGVGQALFLFMGFELVTTQTELARPPAIATALRRSVVVLALFYAVAALGMTALDPTGPPSWLAPPVLLAPADAGRILVGAIATLCLLASFTSWNGALLTLSRLVYALAMQGLLPRGLARMDRRRLVPPNALAALLAISVALTVVLDRPSLVVVVLALAAASAALVWAAAVVARERPPFVEADRPRRHRARAFVLASLFLVFGAGAVVEAVHVPTSKGVIAHAR
jgi:amino acid transporter